MNILILTGQFGMGHCSAAKAIKEEWETKKPEDSVTVVDIFEYVAPRFSKVIYDGFNTMVCKYSKIYNSMNCLADCVEISPFKGIISRKIQSLLEKEQPDRMIVTVPVIAKYICSYKEMNHISIPLDVCITDICIHKDWLAPNAELYLVGAETVKESLIKKGISGDKIRVTGIPVRHCFHDGQTGKEMMYSSPRTPNVLVMGGGLGILRHSKQILAALNASEKVITTVITGTNRKLYRRLKRKYQNLQVVGYTEHVEQYMKEASLILSKPGGITMFEAIHMEVPMYVIRPYLIQEIQNAKYIEEEQFGKVIWKKEKDEVRMLFELLEDEETMGDIRQNMRKCKEQLQMVGFVNEIIR